MTEARPEATEFWRFSLQLYQRPGVEAACLELQDRFGVDVNLVLLAAYLDRLGLGLSEEGAAAVRAAVLPWQRDVTAALRGARRALKGWEADGVLGAAELRASVKRAELDAERAAQALAIGALTVAKKYIRTSSQPFYQNASMLLHASQNADALLEKVALETRAVCTLRAQTDDNVNQSSSDIARNKSRVS